MLMKAENSYRHRGSSDIELRGLQLHIS